tara:strand:- start:3693 stop:4574 length:882 start_codon:yes stop_codon:yes gene_type:complete
MRVRPTGNLRIDWKVQRRRRKKAAPKNIFGSVPQATQKSKPSSPSSIKLPKVRAQIAPPPSVPGSKKREEAPVPTVKEPIAEITKKEAIKPVSEETSIENPQSVETQQTITEEKGDEHILQEQILGKGSSKEIVHKKKPIPSEKITEEQDGGKSLKARQIIQNSMLKASIAVEVAKTQKKTQKKIQQKPAEAPKKPQRKFRNKTSSYQPANRARRLDRSRHMEYKYEMRGLLSKLGIEEEYRSNLLATIWARGERQTTMEAKEFLKEKLDEGIIDDDQMISLEKIVDGYTVRR